MIGTSEALPDLARQVAPVAVGKHDVEQDEIGRLASECLPRAGERPGATSASNPSRPRLLGERFGDRLLVFDKKDAGPHQARWYPPPCGGRHPNVTRQSGPSTGFCLSCAPA